MKNFIQAMKFSSFFLLACGAVVREREALAGLKSITEEYVFLMSHTYILTVPTA